MKMKIKNKILAAVTATILTIACLPTIYTDTVLATETTETPSEVPSVTPTVEAPYLGSGVFSGEYSCSLSTVSKDDQFGLTVNTYLPIENYTYRVHVYDFDDCNIFAVPISNDNFQFGSSYSYTSIEGIVGSFLCVSSSFSRVRCLGNGNSLTYNICYTSRGQSMNVPITLSISEYREIIEEPPVDAVFSLSDGGVRKIPAGTETYLSVNLTKMNDGVFSYVAASLSSSDNSILVEGTNTQTSNYANPQFSFYVSVPINTPAGNYSLTLHTTVYDQKGNASSQDSYTIPILVTSDVVPSGLEISSYQISKKTIKADDHFSLLLTLENKCNIDLKNVKVSLSNLDESKFVLDGGFSSRTVSIAKNASETVSFDLIACAGISSVRESLNISTEYRIYPTDAASTQTLSTAIILECALPDEKPETGKYDITMTDYSINRESIRAGSSFTLKFTLENTSANHIEGARVSILGLDGSKFALNSGLTYADFDLRAGRSRKFSFPLMGCAGISSVREMIPIEISFGQQTQTVYATIPCVPAEEKKEDTNPIFAPPIIIESYNFGGEYVTGGIIFPLNLTVKNAGSNAAIENLKITISGGSGNGNNGVAFSPANSSNSFFIESLRAKETTQLSLDLLPRADANPDSYPVIVTFEYEYLTNGKRAKAETITETITIPLQQEDRLTINQPDYPESLGLGEVAYISVSLINKGKSDVYNVTADFEGEGFDKSAGAYYIGNIASGSEEYYDVQVTPFMEGDVSGEIVITYEDANGTQQEQRSPITINVVSYNWGGEDFPMDDPGMFDDPWMEDDNAKPKWFWPAIGGGAAAIVLIVILIIVKVVKKRKKKRELEMDDEDI